MDPDYLFRRGKNGLYSARLRVPADLRHVFKPEVLVKALKTSDRRLAKKLAMKQVTEWETEFEEARRQPPDINRTDLEALARGYYQARLSDDDEERKRLPTVHQQGLKVEAALQDARANAEDYLKENPDADTSRESLHLLTLGDLLVPDVAELNRDSRAVRFDHLQSHLPKRNFYLISHEAEALIEAKKLPIGTGSPKYLELCEVLMRAEIDLLSRQIERDQGDYTGEPKDPILKADQPEFDRTTFAEIIAERERLAKKGIGGKTTEGTLKKYARIAKEFADWRGSTRAATVTRKEAESWRDELMDGNLSPKTVLDKLAAVKSVLVWGQKSSNGELFPKGLPLETLDMPSTEMRDSASKTYTKDQAATILVAARSQEKPFMRWVPWLAAYSGARVEELLQLEKGDVFEYETAWYYRILHQGDRTTKTKSSRTVPIHPALIEEGFLEFVSSIKDGRLFTDTRMGGNLRDWIRTEILPDLPEPRPKPMHGFRHLFEDLRVGAIESDASKYITGRAIPGSAAQYGKSNALLPELAKQMARFPRLTQ